MRHSTWEDDGGYGLCYEEPETIRTLQCEIDGKSAVAIFKGNEWTRERMIKYFHENNSLKATNFGDTSVMKDELGLVGIVFSNSKRRD